MEPYDYLQNFIADKRARGVPWQHISAMTLKPMDSLRPYMDLEEGYRAAATRDAEREAEARARAEQARKEREALARQVALEKQQKEERRSPHPSPEMRLIAAKIADQYKVTVEGLTGRKNTGALKVARQHLMWALVTKNYSTTRVGKFLGNRDHATVLYGVRAHMCRIAGKSLKEARGKPVSE